MTDTDNTKPAIAWQFWAIGVAGLLWNLLGGIAYVSTQMMTGEQLAEPDPATRAYMEGLPAWFDASWAIAVWGSVAACILLLLRKGWAVPLFLVALIAQLICVIYAILNGAYTLPGGLVTAGMAVAIFIIALGLLLYARRMKAAGILT